MRIDDDWIAILVKQDRPEPDLRQPAIFDRAIDQQRVRLNVDYGSIESEVRAAVNNGPPTVDLDPLKDMRMVSEYQVRACVNGRMPQFSLIRQDTAMTRDRSEERRVGKECRL